MYLFENKVTSQHFGRPAGGLKQITKDKNNTLLSKWQLLSNPIPTNAKVVLGLVTYLVSQYDNSQKWEKSEGTFRLFETMKIQLYAIYERHKQHISYSRQGLFRGLPLGMEQKLADQDDLLRLCLSVKSSIFSGLRVL